MSQKKHNRSENRRNKQAPGFSVFSPETWSERRLKFYTAGELTSKNTRLKLIRQNIHKPAILRKIDFEIQTINSLIL